jgi:hypothetical protein
VVEGGASHLSPHRLALSVECRLAAFLEHVRSAMQAAQRVVLRKDIFIDEHKKAANRHNIATWKI